MSYQRLKNAVMEADARGFRLHLRPEGVEIVARWGVESWHRLVGWSEIDSAADCPLSIAMETIGREIVELRKGVVGRAGLQ
jgi:hypothetical protein